MKKAVLIGLAVLIGWAGFSYFSASWNREQFTNEVDSLLQSPRDLNEASLIPLILHKAKLSSVDLRPEDINVKFESVNRETTTSNLLENKGFSADVRKLDLHLVYRQTFLGITKTLTLDRERTFTSQITPNAQPSSYPPDSQ